MNTKDFESSSNLFDLSNRKNLIEALAFKDKPHDYILLKISQLSSKTIWEKDKDAVKDIQLAMMALTDGQLAMDLPMKYRAEFLAVKSNIFKDMLLLDNALQCAKDTILCYEKLENHDIYRLVEYYEQAIELLVTLKKYNEVIDYVMPAVELCTKNNQAQIYLFSNLMIHKADAYFHLGLIPLAFETIDKVIYQFPKGSINQYMNYSALNKRARFKKLIGDLSGYEMDSNMADEWLGNN